MRIDDKNFRPISCVKDFDSWDILRMGCKGQIDLYTVIKKNLVLIYDYCEVIKCPNTGDEIFSVEEHDAEISYDYGDMVQLPTVAVEDLLLNGKVDERTLYQVFASSDTNLRLHTTANLDPITISDVFVNQECLKKPVDKKSKRVAQPHIQGIRDAFQALGSKALNEDIYEWMEKMTHDPTQTTTFWADLEFPSKINDLERFSTSYQNAIILKSKGRQLTKQRFQDICSEERG